MILGKECFLKKSKISFEYIQSKPLEKISLYSHFLDEQIYISGEILKKKVFNAHIGTVTIGKTIF